MMHQTVERLLRVPRRLPSYPGQLRGRCHLRLWWSHNVSPPRVILPRVLPSTGVTPLLRYYDPSDFLIVISAFLFCPLVCRYFPPWKNDEDLPRSPRCFGYMPCSLTPEVSSPPAHERWREWCLRAFRHPRPPHKSVLTGLIRFNLPVYGLHPPCLRLTHAVTGVSPRLGMECVGSTLFQSHLQRQAAVRFVAHRKYTLSSNPFQFSRIQGNYAKFSTRCCGIPWG